MPELNNALVMGVMMRLLILIKQLAVTSVSRQ